jgi:hypothetical protein
VLVCRVPGRLLQTKPSSTIVGVGDHVQHDWLGAISLVSQYKQQMGSKKTCTKFLIEVEHDELIMIAHGRRTPLTVPPSATAQLRHFLVVSVGDVFFTFAEVTGHGNQSQATEGGIEKRTIVSSAVHPSSLDLHRRERPASSLPAVVPSAVHQHAASTH